MRECRCGHLRVSSFSRITFHVSRFTHHVSLLMAQQEAQLRAQLVEIGRRIYANGYVAATDGNLSARLDDGTVLTTPTMVCKGRMTPDMLVLVDSNGTKLRAEERNPSSEFAMHREIYRLRPDVRAVVHAHPPFGT